MKKTGGENLRGDRSRLTKALAVSLLFHAYLLTLRFDISGLGLPGLDLPWQERRAQAPALSVVLAAPSGAALSTLGEPPPPLQAPAPTPSVSRPVMEEASSAAPAVETAALPSPPPAPAMAPNPAPSFNVAITTVPAPIPPPQAAPEPTQSLAAPRKRITHKPPHAKVIAQEKPLRETFSVPPPAPEAPAAEIQDAQETAAAEISAQPSDDAAMTPKADEEAARREREQELSRQEEARLALETEARQRAEEQKRELQRQAQEALARKQAEQLAAELAAQQAREAQRQEALRQAWEAEESERARRQEAQRLAAEAAARKQAEADLAAKEIVRQQALLLEKQQAEQLAAELVAQQMREAEQRQRAKEQQDAVRQQAAAAEARTQALEAERQARAALARKAAEEAGQRQAAEMAARAQAAGLARQQVLALEGGRGTEPKGSGLKGAESQSSQGGDKAGAQSVAPQGGAATASPGGGDKAGRGETRGTDATPGGAGGQANTAAVGAGAATDGGMVSGPAPVVQAGVKRQSESPLGSPPAPSYPSVPANSPRRKTLIGSFGQEIDIELMIFAEVWRRNVNTKAPFSLIEKTKTEGYKNPWVIVALRSDGSVEGIKFDRSSGVQELDNAVRQIILMLAPYGDFPPELAAEYDIIEIPSIWTFNKALRLIWGGG